MSFKGKILLVDDEAHVRKYIGLIARQLGSPQLIEASNGREAVELYQSEKPDLVLLDVNMPLQDGIQTLKQLNQVDPDCVVIMMTSLASRQIIEEAAELGAANYIRKDTSKEAILSLLQQTISQCFAND